MSDRKSPSGPASSVKGIIAIAATPVAVTTVATATGSFVPTSGPNVQVGNVISLSPQANLTAAITVAWQRVYDEGLVVIGFLNAAANSTQAAVTFDANAEIL